MKIVKRFIVTSIYRFAVWTEYARPRFLEFQYNVMLNLIKLSLKFRGRQSSSNEEQNQESVEFMEMYKLRFENWGKLVFLKNAESDWLLQWRLFVKFL